MATATKIKPSGKKAGQKPKKSAIVFGLLAGKVYIAPDAFTKDEMRGYDFKNQPKPEDLRKK